MADTTQIHFLIENQNYGIEIMDVRAVEKYENISSVLGAPAYIEGVLNLRGELIPVYSIRQKFGLPARKPDDATKLIIVNLAELPVAIVVDSVVGIRTVPQQQESERPRILNAVNTGFVGRVAQVDDRIIVLLDLAALISEEERQEMAAMLEAGQQE